jgi:hypothetical protein
MCTAYVSVYRMRSPLALSGDPSDKSFIQRVEDGPAALLDGWRFHPEVDRTVELGLPRPSRCNRVLDTILKGTKGFEKHLPLPWATSRRDSTIVA